MKREAEVRELLISNAIHLIALGGFEMATTKEIALSGGHLEGLKMNEVYIYRLFGSKELLYEAAFKKLDDELFYAFQNGVKAVGGFEQDTKNRLYKFFLMAWRFVLGNEEKCRCYVRYCYSVYFKGESKKYHNEIFGNVVSAMAPLFKEEADVTAIMHSVFIALFNFAIRVYNGELEDNEFNRPHVFNVLYCMMMTYFKDADNAHVCA